MLAALPGAFLGFVGGFAWGAFFASLSFFGPVSHLEDCLVVGFWTGMIGAVLGGVVCAAAFGLLAGLVAFGELLFRRWQRSVK